MSETFNFKRFCTFFGYDLKQMWRRNAKTAILIGGGGLIFTLFWISFSLLFFLKFSTPTWPWRLGMFVVCVTILHFFITRTYGFLTDRKKGPDYLMVPASGLEKYISMMIITIIIIPLIFTLAYFSIDALLCLCFPESGANLFQMTSTFFDNAFVGINEMNNQLAKEMIPFRMPASNIVIILLLMHGFNMLYYLLCGLIFKRFKILWSIIISVLLGIIVSSVMTAYVGVGHFGPWQEMQTLAPTPEEAFGIVERMFTFIKCYMIVGIVAMAVGIYFRLKKVSH